VALLHHREYTHNDIKPENFLVRQADNRMLLIDFGNARKQEKEGITTAFFRRRRLSRIRGTPAYMAPEVLAGKRPNYRSDVYALGACAHFLFTNHLIIRRDLATSTTAQTALAAEIRINVPGLPRELNDILSRCIRTEPEARPDTAVVLLDFLKRYLPKAMLTGVDKLSRSLAEKALAAQQQQAQQDDQRRSEIEEAARRASARDKFIG
jgi:serine/threonine protein kinase